MEFHGLVAHRPATLLNHHQLNTQSCVCGGGGGGGKKKKKKEKTKLCQFGKQRGEKGLMDLDVTSFLELETRAFANQLFHTRPAPSSKNWDLTLSLKKDGP